MGVDVWPADSYTRPANAAVQQNERDEKIKQGGYFDIRYGCIVSADVDNLLMGGRIVSAGHFAESALRIQQTCMATGEAAGYAAALSIENDTTPRELDPMLVVNKLAEVRAAVKKIDFDSLVASVK